MRFNLGQPLLIASLLISTVVITACSPKNEKSERVHSESAEVSDDLKEQIEAKPIKPFAKTSDDAHDIALLDEYEANFNTISTDLENELKKLQDEANLTEDMKNQRKRDLIQSSLNMLKELDLKTEQGRYIQGLFYQYWENQMNVYNELINSPENELQDPTDAVKGRGDYYTAEAQLKHWKTQ